MKTMNEISEDSIFPMLKPISLRFFLQDISKIARALLNCVLYTYAEDGTIVGGRIIETESYTQDDEASHSYKGQTKRCRAMFMQGGTVYVYLIYGMYHCCNIVTGTADKGDAVLLRSLEPYWGLSTMASRRKFQARTYVQNVLCRGPGCLSIALGITTSQHNETVIISKKINADNALKGRVYLMNLPASMHVHMQNIVATTRIGITKSAQARAQKSRFYISGNPCISYPLKY